MKGSDPIIVRGLQLINRYVRAAYATQTAHEDGTVSEDTIAHYTARAKGNIGLLVTGLMSVHYTGNGMPKQVLIDRDEMVEGLARFTDAVHTTGPAKIFAQIAHCGSKTDPRLTGGELIAPSAVMNRGLRPGQTAPIPRAMTVEEIHRIEDAFVKAAVRAVRAGFDGVELHSAHAYLLDQFYSPLTNLRTDEYGGSLENRLRIHTEILRAVREEVGTGVPIAVRFGGSDYMEGGATIEDAVAGAILLEEAGADLLDVSGGMCRYILKDRTEPGYFSDMTAAIREKVHIPVVLTGGIRTREDADRLLSEGKADMIGIGRALFADPDWPD